MKSRLSSLRNLHSFDVSNGLNVFHTESVENTDTNTTELNMTTPVVAGDASAPLVLKEKGN